MGNALVCLERGHWDPHPDIQAKYPHSHEVASRQRMDLPLSCYFISSGHNSYLTGNQLNSDSGTKTITSCLLKGCRVIELDVYNQQPGFHGPVCKHGGTLTKPVAFRDCVAAVRSAAFTMSPYPVIITLETHADEKNQIEIAEILAHELGPALYVPQPGEPGDTWKSPQELSNKILIRANAGKCCEELKRLVYVCNTKFVSTGAANSNAIVTSSSFGEAKLLKMQRKAYANAGLKLKEVPEEVYDDVPPVPKLSSSSRGWLSPRRASTGNMASAGTSSQWGSGGGAQEWGHASGPQSPGGAPGRTSRRALAQQRRSERGPSSRRAQAAAHRAESKAERAVSHPHQPRTSRRQQRQAELDAEQLHYDHQYTRAYGHGGESGGWELEEGEEAGAAGDEAAAAATGTLMDLYTYTARHLMRVYPGGLRIDSSNPDPMHAWTLGASLAALNWQKWDTALWVNTAMFARNGACGYVLKPDWMLQGIPGFGGPAAAAARSLSGTPTRNPLPDRPARALRVHLHSAFAHQGGGCMCFRDDLFMQVEVRGMPEDCAKITTHTHHNTGRLLIERVYELRVVYPEMAVLMLRLMDDDLPGAGWDDTVGYWAVAVSELVPGSYCLQLNDPDTGLVRPPPHERWAKVTFEWVDENGEGDGENGEVDVVRVGGATRAHTAPPLSLPPHASGGGSGVPLPQLPSDGGGGGGSGQVRTSPRGYGAPGSGRSNDGGYSGSPGYGHTSPQDGFRQRQRPGRTTPPQRSPSPSGGYAGGYTPPRLSGPGNGGEDGGARRSVGGGAGRVSGSGYNSSGAAASPSDPPLRSRRNTREASRSPPPPGRGDQRGSNGYEEESDNGYREGGGYAGGGAARRRQQQDSGDGYKTAAAAAAYSSPPSAKQVPPPAAPAAVPLRPSAGSLSPRTSDGAAYSPNPLGGGQMPDGVSPGSGGKRDRKRMH